MARFTNSNRKAAKDMAAVNSRKSADTATRLSEPEILEIFGAFCVWPTSG